MPLTASQAIDRIAAKTDLQQGTVFRAARVLRETDPELWPQGSQGRGQEARVNSTHLVNLVFALASHPPYPITEAAKIARLYWNLRWQPRRPGINPDVMPCLGAFLADLITGGPPPLSVTLLFHMPAACVTMTQPNGERLEARYGAAPPATENPKGIRLASELRPALFAAMHEIVTD